MKRFAWIIITSVMLLSLGCKQAEEPEMFLNGEWVLVESINPFNPEPFTGVDLPFREAYTFRQDLTFSKSRDEDGDLTVATGTYTIHAAGPDQPGVQHDLVLTFETNEELVGDCTFGNVEHLVLPSMQRLENTWHFCDGPKYIYERVR